MVWSEAEIVEFVSTIESELNNMEKIKFSFDRSWSKKFPDGPGVYAIFDKDKLVYFGETANIKERMKEVKRTVNHSFRRKLGRKINPEAKIVKGKFPKELEAFLDRFYKVRLYFAYKSLNFGRLEVESHLIHRNYGKGLLNSLGKRNKI